MKEKTKQLLEQVENNHDWEEGSVRGGNGTQLNKTDTCRVCGLSRHWFSDKQNGVVSRYTFTTHAGNQIPLVEAAALKCC